VAWVWGGRLRFVRETLKPRSNTWTALRLAISTHSNLPEGLRREACTTSTLLEYRKAGCDANSCRHVLAAVPCNPLTLTKPRSSRNRRSLWRRVEKWKTTLRAPHLPHLTWDSLEASVTDVSGSDTSRLQQDNASRRLPATSPKRSSAESSRRDAAVAWGVLRQTQPRGCG